MGVDLSPGLSCVPSNLGPEHSQLVVRVDQNSTSDESLKLEPARRSPPVLLRPIEEFRDHREGQNDLAAMQVLPVAGAADRVFLEYKRGNVTVDDDQVRRRSGHPHSPSRASFSSSRWLLCCRMASRSASHSFISASSS